MDIAVTIFTIVLVAIFVVIIIIAFFKEKKSLSKYTTNLIFKNYLHYNCKNIFVQLVKIW